MFADAGYAASDDYRRFWDRLNRGEFVAAELKRFAKGNRESGFRPATTLSLMLPAASSAS